MAQVQAALPNGDLLASASLKLKGLAELRPDSVSQGADEIFQTWACGSKNYHAHERHIALLIEAILRRQRCVVKYRTPARLTSKTYEFDPYRLLLVGGGLYVVGCVPKYAGTATLAIDRLLSIVISKASFDIDPGFDPEKRRRDAFGVSRQDPIDVLLRFSADQAPYVRERMWHPSPEAHGTCRWWRPA